MSIEDQSVSVTMNIKYCLISAMLLGFGQADRALIEFIKDYYAANYIHQIVVFGCWDYAMDLSRSIMDSNTVVTYQQTSEEVDLTRLLHVDYYHIGVVLDLECPFSERILDNFSDRLNFNESYYWLVLSNLSQAPTPYLETLKLTIASEFTLAIRKNDEFHLQDIYNPSYRHGGAVKLVHKGWWTPEYGLKNELTEYKYLRRDMDWVTMNFSVVVVSTPSPDLITHLSFPFNDGSDTMARSHYTMLLHLQDLYHFDIKLHYTKNWGYIVNGSFTGLVGDIVAGFIDMSVSPLEFRQNRLDVVAYTVPTWFSNPIFSFLHPKSSTLKNNFLMPFENDVWYTILLVATVYWTLLLTSLLLELQYNVGSSVALSTSPISETSLTTVAALSQQGLSDSPNFISGRITFLSLFLWALLLYQFYSASIVSSLLTPPPHWIKTISDLARSELEVGTLNLSYFTDMFSNSKDPEVIDLYRRKVSQVKDRSRVQLDGTAGVREVQKGGYAFGSESSSTYTLMKKMFNEDQICELEIIQIAKPTRIAPIVPKHSPFKKMMTYGYRKIVQSGLWIRLVKKWRGRRPECPEGHNLEPTAMSIREFSPALFLLCIGVGISLVVLAIEFLFSHLEKRRDSQRVTIQSSDDAVSSRELNPGLKNKPVEF